jgi:hypothetical protein
MSYVIPPGSHRIPLEQAKSMVVRYAEKKDQIFSPDALAQNALPISETFRKDAIIEFLSKDIVHAIRIYYGMSEDLLVHAIIVGVDKDGNDILPKGVGHPGHGHGGGHGGGHGHPHPPGDGEDGEIFEDAQRCPTYCPTTGCQLNS